MSVSFYTYMSLKNDSVRWFCNLYLTNLSAITTSKNTLQVRLFVDDGIAFIQQQPAINTPSHNSKK